MNDTPHPLTGTRPLIVAANRLPVTREPDGNWSASPGGLVRALLPTVRETGGSWVGWTGQPGGTDDDIHLDGIALHSVALSNAELHQYYEGMSNDTLWPLYHDAIRESAYHGDDWDSYVRVNQRFAERVAEIAPADAAVWVHDYHLQLVPGALRRLRSDVRIGFFNHIPFPPLELFRRLPWRSEIIEGLLGADVIGFQRASDATNMIAAATDLLGEVDAPEPVVADHLVSVGYRGHRSLIGAFPISIDVAEIEEPAGGRAARRQAIDIRARLGSPEVILLGVDRLDYTKGIGPRLRAFGQLLDDGRLDPERHVLVQVATPTREGVEHYQDERREIEQIVGEINGRHARLGFPVIHYLYRTLPLEDLIPLYRAGDVMLVTPYRDGMNLVAKEYVAANADGDGVLVLSEFTGAADELREALLVNPHDPVALQDAIAQAVDMPRQERGERMQAMRSTIAGSTVADWARSFLDVLDGEVPEG
jgi:trehalose 6-phosphate synthase